MKLLPLYPSLRTTMVVVAMVTWIRGTHAEAINPDLRTTKLRCNASDTICKVDFKLTQLQTMVVYENGTGLGFPVVYKDGSFMQRRNCTAGGYTSLYQDIKEATNQGNGIPKLVYAVNDNMPGDTIVVYSNQTLQITVYNNLIQESTGIHWHGMYQRGSPWMDGVTSVTQCPINLQETFVYRFKPEPEGTHWYHSHTSLQRADGLFGALIVLPTEERSDLPSFDKDFLVMIQDWQQMNIVPKYHASVYKFDDYLKNGFDADTCTKHDTATVINGIGHLSTGINGTLKDVTTYTVTENMAYRFRFLNVGGDEAYLVRIDQHKMTVIASDGQPLEPYEADGLVIHVGERYDVNITADRPGGLDNYWIRFSKIDVNSIVPKIKDDHVGYAILNYGGANTNMAPPSTEVTCTVPCKIVNCPSQNFNDSLNYYECMGIGEMNSTEGDTHQGDIQEFFFAFGFTALIEGNDIASVNGIHHTIPSKPPQVYRRVDFDRPCENYNCNTKSCLCNHMIKLTLGKTIQFTMASTENAHPIHLHGHDFQVIKVVHLEGNATSKMIHPDLNCPSSNEPRCTDPTWSNSSWLGGNVPGIKTKNPPKKDTVIVPAHGYVVIRFKADNPGWWMFHCHIENHLEEGMGLIVQEGEEDDMPEAPKGFPTCGSFLYDQEDPPVVTTEGNGTSSSLHPIVSPWILLSALLLLFELFCFSRD